MTETKQTQLEELLDYLEGRYTDFMSSNGPVPITIIRTELRELREKCENWEIAARVAALDEQFPEFRDVQHQDQEPDGWQAIRDTDGMRHEVFLSQESCKRNLLIQKLRLMKDYDMYGKSEEFFINRDHFWNEAQAQGWRIRPVKLQPLDGGEG